MSERRSSSPSVPAAASGRGGGCLSGFLLPPLAVVAVGAMLMFFSLGTVNPVSSTEISAQTGEAHTRNPLLPVSPIFTPEVQYWSARIQVWAVAAGLDPNLVATVMQIESCGDPSAQSRAGAMGLFQVMPYHFTAGEDPYEPENNALRGLDYLRRSLEAANGDPRLALAGYNGGIGVIGQSEYKWTAETQRYAARGSGIYQDAASGKTESPYLQEWLTASGVYLCRQAHERLGISP